MGDYGVGRKNREGRMAQVAALPSFTEKCRN